MLFVMYWFEPLHVEQAVMLVIAPVGEPSMVDQRNSTDEQDAEDNTRNKLWLIDSINA